jgi:hypothetical protein
VGRETEIASLVGRYYDPATGQFISVDPDLASTGQPYSFAGGDPVNGSDPNGSFFMGDGGQTAGINSAGVPVDNSENAAIQNAEAPVFGPPAPPGPAEQKTEPVSGSGPARQTGTAANVVQVLNGLTSDAANIQLGADVTTAVCWDCSVVTIPISATAGYVQTGTTCASFGISLFTHGGIKRTGIDCAVGIAESGFGDLIQVETVYHGIHYGGVALDAAGKAVDWFLR